MDLKQKGLLLVLGTAIISGISIFINSIGVAGFDPAVFTFAKNLLVGLLLVAVIIAAGQWKHIKNLTKKQWLQLGLVGLIGGSIPFLLFFQGLQLAAGSTASFIHKSMFILVAVLAMLFLKEKPTKGTIAGASILLAGTYLLIRPGFSLSIGHMFILAATVFWAGEQVLSKHLLKELSGTVVAVGRMGFGSLFLLGYLVVTGKAALIGSMTAVQYGWIGVTTAFLFLYVFTYYNGLQHIKVSAATALLTWGALITALLQWAFQGTAISLLEAAGFALLVVGAALMAGLASGRKLVHVQAQEAEDGRD